MVVSEDRKCFSGCHASYVANPGVTGHCEKGCCSMSTIPLRIYIAINTNNGQEGLTGGPGVIFNRIVVHLLLGSKRGISTVNGLELALFCRTKDLNCVAIENPAHEIGKN